MGLFDTIKSYKDQNYAALKKECVEKGALFIDPEFPPDDRSLFFTKDKIRGVVWKRPKVRNTHVFITDILTTRS